MRCPDCKLELVILEVDGIELDLCIKDHGFWFDADELSQLFLKAGAPSEFQFLEQRLQKVVVESGSAKRCCPRCSARLRPMGMAEGSGPVLDSCPNGHGLWFDPGELEMLGAAVLSEDDPALLRVQEYLGNFFPPVEKR